MDDWQQAEPVRHQGGLTLFSGSTFVLTDGAGELHEEPHGFFVADRRVLSRLTLGVERHALEVLRSTRSDENEAQVLRRSTGAGEEMHALLFCTEIEVRPGELLLRILIRNGAAEPRDIDWTLRAAADFADIFAVKEARAPHVHHESAKLVGHHQLVIEGDGGLRTELTFREGSVVELEHGVSEHLVIPRHTTVERLVTVEAFSSQGRLGEPMTSHVRPLRRPQVSTRSTELSDALARGLEDLDALRVQDRLTGSATLAAGAPWFMTLFGRDSLISAIMAASYDQRLGLDVLRSLAGRQGRTVDPVSEEEPGRIVHETRMTTGTSLFEGNRTRYYGSTDATPLFVIALADLVRHGLGHDDAVALLPNADGCLSWISQYGDIDGDGFVESVRRHDGGLINQGWKDSWNAIVDEDGQVVDAPLSLIEVQAYWYAALRSRAYLARALEGGSGATWDAQAETLRVAIDDAFWLPDLQTYALALGPDKAVLRTSTSNAGHMLWTGAALPERVAGLGSTLMQRTLRTHWGLRTLTARNPAYDPLGYHTGSVWPHDTALVAWGMSRWGLGRAGRELGQALIRASSFFEGTLPELVAGFDVGDELGGGSPVRFPTACSPQAWAAASPLLVLRSVLGLEVDIPGKRVWLDPHVPEDWLPLTVHGIRLGPLRIVVKVTHDRAHVEGVPDGFEIVRGSFFDS
ncbi:MAG TPA: glycogen debranching N-terminal domain-containing protein [Candidatus Nanopelagicales bacterium]|nr:glycogen debranching N-terminal domain-containing protein [Candidatus Nanopelagicales bacterium]